MTKHPIPVGWVHFALAVGGFAIGTTEFATMSLLPFMARDLAIDEPTAGHVISAYALGVVVGAPVIAILSAKVARRTLLIALMTMFAVGNGLSALAPTYGWMLLFRFLSGLPHGAYFGIAALVAAGLVPFERRTAAVGRVILGLTVATIVGVPVTGLVGQVLGWRSVFVIVTALALATAALVALLAPRDTVAEGASPLRELGALRRPQVWLALATAAIGFGGLFAVYTYFANTLMEVTGVWVGHVPLLFGVFGVGMTLGSLIMPRFADRALMPTIGGLILFSAAALALYPLAAHNVWTVALDVLAIGFGSSFAIAIQTRLMDVAGDAQALAAALNHAAFNTANAIGPWAGGLAIAAGYGWTSTGWVGAGLALAGFAIWAVSYLTSRERPVSRPAGAGLPPPADRRRAGTGR